MPTSATDPFKLRRQFDGFTGIFQQMYDEWKSEGTPVFDALRNLIDPNSVRTHAHKADAWLTAGVALANTHLKESPASELAAARLEPTPDYGPSREQLSRRAVWELLTAGVSGNRGAIDEKLSDITAWLVEDSANLPLFLDHASYFARGFAGRWEGHRSRRFVDRIDREVKQMGGGQFRRFRSGPGVSSSTLTWGRLSGTGCQKCGPVRRSCIRPI